MVRHFRHAAVGTVSWQVDQPYRARHVGRTGQPQHGLGSQTRAAGDKQPVPPPLSLRDAAQPDPRPRPAILTLRPHVTSPFLTRTCALAHLRTCALAHLRTCALAHLRTSDPCNQNPDALPPAGPSNHSDSPATAQLAAAPALLRVRQEAMSGSRPRAVRRWPRSRADGRAGSDAGAVGCPSATPG
uniref:Putative cytoplasmic protein n=1 Tax=Streptomyces platensis TaxID=58346 RepID=D3Y138_STRPT|nr:putative cytoplasmic protein [Streptomyces platensis]